MSPEVTLLLWFGVVVIVFLIFFYLLHCRWIRRLHEVKKLPPITVYNYSLDEFLGLEIEYDTPQPRIPFVS